MSCHLIYIYIHIHKIYTSYANIENEYILIAIFKNKKLNGYRRPKAKKDINERIKGQNKIN